MLRDLPSHMLTHLPSRPEKCPIPTCSYHKKGFARKYDKNRHTLTHYRGTLVCGFCPGAGTSAEKGFNRADVFKRHLGGVHGVEMGGGGGGGKAGKGSRKGSSRTAGEAKNGGGGNGRCSTCGVIFDGAQALYEHLDECVLRIVQRVEACEGVNQTHLEATVGDEEIERKMVDCGVELGYSTGLGAASEEDGVSEEDMGEVEDEEVADEWSGTSHLGTANHAGPIHAQQTGANSH